MTQEERNTNKLQWELRIQTFQDSGLTQQQWCEKEGLKRSALRYWLRTLYCRYVFISTI